jgi:hypothetical protein
LSCRDVGYSCDFILEGKAEDDTFITNGLERALKERGLKPENITPELKEKLKGLIHNSWSIRIVLLQYELNLNRLMQLGLPIAKIAKSLHCRVFSI